MPEPKNLIVIPALPPFPQPSSAIRNKMLGRFAFIRLGGGQVKILNGWAEKNIVKVPLPQLRGVENAPKDLHVYFHRAGAKQLQAMFAAWERAGLLHLVKTWAGSFVPRMVRGSSTELSNHAFGSAFDINAAWNGLGRPAATGTGTVIPLVKIANQHGFYWGGHYLGRKDAMHFELAVAGMFPENSRAAHKLPIASSEVATSNTSATVIPSVPAIGETAGNLPETNTGENSADKSKATETTESETIDTPEGQKKQETTLVNQQNVDEKVPIEQPKPQGIKAKLTAGIGSLLGGTLIYTLAERFGAMTFSMQSIILISVVCFFALLGFMFWSFMDAWKANNKITH